MTPAKPLAWFLLASSCLPALAQTSAALRVRRVGSAGQPLANALVTVHSIERAEKRTARTDAAGWASFAGMLPGRYRIEGQEIALKPDSRMELVIRQQEAAAVVEIEASPLRTETSSVGVQATLLASDLERIPFAPHRFAEQSAVMPGVSPSGKPEPVVLGSMLDGNSFQVDGMATNLASTGRFGMNLSSEVLESQTVTTGGHKAEVGFAPGGVFNLVTKTGTNTLKGSLFASAIDRSLNAKVEDGKANNPEERATHAREWGVTVGGAFIPDRLFFFGAFNRQLTDQDFDNITPPGGAPHRRTLAEDRSYRFFKLTWLATDNHRLEVAWFGDPVVQRNFDDPANASLKDEQLGSRTRGGNSWLVKHVGVLGANLTWENTLGLHRTAFQWSPAVPEAGPNRAQLDAPLRESFGRYAEDRLERVENLSLRSEFTLFAGGHQVKVGFQGLRSDFTTEYRRPSSGLAFLDRAAGGSGPAAGDITAIRAGLLALNGSDYAYANGDSLLTASPVSGQLAGGRASYLYQRTLASLASYGDPLRQRTLGIFAQDDWQVGLGWTLNLGLRVDRAAVDGEDGRGLYRQTLLSPRLGVSWDPTRDGRNRIFAYAGHIYSPPTPGALAAAGATSGGPATTRQVWIPTLSEWRTWQQTGVQGVRNVAIAPDLKAARTDLYQLGAERLQPIPALGTWILEGVLTLKRTHDLIDTYNPAWGYLPQYDAAANATAGKRYVGNLPGLERTFKGLDLSAHRRFAGGHLFQISYSQGDLRGNSQVGGVASATGRNTGFASIPSLRQDYRQAAYDGPLNESLKHSWKAYGSAALPFGFELSGVVLHRSGLRYSALVTASGDAVLAPGETRGNRELPKVTTVDLSIAKVFTLPKSSLRTAVEVFNLLNAQPMIWVNNVGATTTPGNHLQPRALQFSARLTF
ncbi:MAG: TonB-dependent receptor [Acidobacteria bacterium]|nr:TonB-dependent receptor [Acidobacteriota bacterium]